MDALASNTPVKIRSDMTFERKIDPINISYMSERCRSYIKIEDGCNSHCAYCIISTARGPARSKAPEDTLREVRQLAAAGYKEVILTGIELASYKGDLPALVKEISNIPGIERIRLGSLDPAYLTPARIDKLREATKLAPHFHIVLILR